jgi:hypothetical protein
MSRLSWIAPLYGYLVCVIAVITFLVNVSGFIDATFDRMDPFASGRSYGPYGGSLRSFESFRATYEGSRPMRADPTPGARTDTLSTAELRTRYEAMREDHVVQARHQSTQRLVKHGLLLLLSILLFLTHWIWAQRQRESIVAQ